VVPHPFRAVLGALLGCALIAAGSLGAAPASARSSGHHPTPQRYDGAEARVVLHRATHLMRGTPARVDSRPANADLTMALRDLHLARPALHGAERRAADRLLSRTTVAAKTQAAAAGSLTTRCSAHFCVHYGSGTTYSWATTTLNTLEHVWAVEVPMMNRQPLPDGGTAGDDTNPDNRVDVFLEDLGFEGYYGYCTTDDLTGAQQVSAYCALDDDFARDQFGAKPVDALRVTAAHEFFHAIQFAADVTEDVWFMEGSATWAEDVVYDSVNDNYQYLSNSPIRHPRTALDFSGGSYPYGSFIFFTYAAERRGGSVVRQFWDEAVGVRTSLQAVRAIVGVSAWPAFFATFGSWNTLPLHSYSERAGYPAPAWWVRKTLTAKARTTGVRRVMLSHLGNSAVLVAPGPKLAPGKRLLVTIDAPPRSTGSAALLQRRYRNGRVTHTMITLGANGNGRTLVQFNRRVLSSIAVVVSNTNRYGPARGFKVRATVR
jgi:hypothetical protein